MSRETLETLYQVMVRIRRFDEKTAELFLSGHVKGTAHSYVGQEAPIMRVGARNVPMPYNDKLELATIPSRDDIMAAIRSTL
jgi:TPP-dependent pyruvate/acetoin dehydrogenase alpha subunit